MKTGFLMAIHFHQPVGNLDGVMETASDNCYQPFIETVSEYPDIKLSLHLTGPLLEWMAERRPGLIVKIRDMAVSGRVEILGGGFYEPILPVIPERDRLGQIAMLNKKILELFGVRPRGIWMAERVWEPGIARTLAEAGAEYTILDDTQFMAAGIPKDRTYRYYSTDGVGGRPIAVFPGDKNLRYGIPFRMPCECVEYMKEVLKRDPAAVFVYADDGEKFGEWPGTKKWVYEDGWLRAFLDELVKNQEWLETRTFSGHMSDVHSSGRVHVPASSYEEMLEWSLFLEHREGSSKGKEGGWRNFLVKYPEAGAMHRKMLRVSARLAGLEKENGADALAQARAELYKGQCNCAYWHGVFGGLYLFHLRRSVFHHLLACEKEMDAIVHGAAPFIETLIADHGGDGDDEVIVANGGIVLLIDPSGGGAIREISSKKVCHNIMNTMTRRKEPYHARIIEKIVNGNKKLADCKTVDDIIEVGDPAIGEHLIYDRYPRASLVDHFLDRDVLSEDLGRSSYDEKGDLWNGRYTMMVDKKAEGVRLVLEADGKAGGSKVRVSKKIDLGKDSHGFSVEYTLTNTGEGTLDTVFGAELNIALPHADSCMYTVQVNGEMPLMGMKDRFDLPEANSYYINDGTDLVSFRIDILTPCRLVSFPVKTVSQSERQYELNYQGTGLFLLLAVSLGPGEIQKMVFRIDLTA